MKAAKTAAVSLALVCGLALGGCAADQQTGSTSTATQQTPIASAPAPSKNAAPEEILDAISADFEATEQAIADNLAATKNALGDTYETYLANKTALSDWYETTQKAADDLFARTEANSKQYFNALAAQGETVDSRDINDGMKAWYRAVYEDAFKGFYQAVYEDDLRSCTRRITTAYLTPHTARWTTANCLTSPAHSIASIPMLPRICTVATLMRSPIITACIRM